MKQDKSVSIGTYIHCYAGTQYKTDHMDNGTGRIGFGDVWLFFQGEEAEAEFLEAVDMLRPASDRSIINRERAMRKALEMVRDRLSGLDESIVKEIDAILTWKG